MFLSIIIPVYNTEKYIAECLDSCLAQDISADEYEIICVNDGSSDGSLVVLQSYAERYGNVKVITKENTGVSDARNVGIRESKGEYIWFVDSDDVVVSNVLGALQMRCLETDCDRLLFRVAVTLHDIPLVSQWEEAVKSGSVIEKPFKKKLSVSSLMKRQFLLSREIWFPTWLMYGEDEIFNHTWSMYQYNLEYYDRVLYFYRTRPGSAMQSRSNLALVNRANANLKISLWLRDNGNLDLECENESFNSEFAQDYMRHVEGLFWAMVRLPWRYTHSLRKQIRRTKLLSKKYMFELLSNDKVVRNSAVGKDLYTSYVKKRIRFVCKHPKRFFGK